MSLTVPNCPNPACSTQVNPFPERGQTLNWTYCLLGEISSGIKAGKQFMLRVFKRPCLTLKSAETGVGHEHLK